MNTAGSEDPKPEGSEQRRGSRWTSGIGAVTAVTTLLAAVTGLIVTLNQLGVFSGGKSKDATVLPGGTTGGPGSDFSEPAGLFKPIARANGRAYFDGASLYLTASKPHHPLAELADRADRADLADLADVDVRVRAEKVSGATDYGLGIICRYEEAGRYYLFSVLSGGRYNIVKYGRGRGVSVIGGMKTSSAIAAGATDIEARCVGDDPTLLTLTVDGRRLAKGSDPSGIKSGTVGIRVGTDESVVTFKFDRFVVRSL